MNWVKAMRLVLVTAPSATEFSDLDYLNKVRAQFVDVPVLGPLVVAAIAMRCGVEVELVDSNRLYVEWLAEGGRRERFVDRLAGEVAAREGDIVGFSTLCGSYPSTLLAARQLKKLSPGIPVLLGGPEASALARETMATCSYVDFVLRGEVEESLPSFLDSVDSDLAGVAGLVWRDQLGGVVANPVSAPPASDRMVMPAYELWGVSPGLTLPVEAGRGCPFACRFCSTSSFFGRRPRMKPPSQLIGEIEVLAERYRPLAISLVHDNMAAAPRLVEEFVSLWRGSKKLSGTRWMCSLRCDSLTDAAVQTLSSGGCSTVFVGIESGSSAMQKVIGKRLDLAGARQRLSTLTDAGIEAVVSFIAGFPEESVRDFRDTLDFYGWALSNRRLRPQMAVLCPLADSSYREEYRSQLYFDSSFSAMVHQGNEIDKEMLSFIEGMPDLFCAHMAFPLKHLSRSFLVSAAAFLKYGTHRFRWLVVAASHISGGMLELLERWDGYLASSSSASRGHEYYVSERFAEDFFGFVESLCRGAGESSSFAAPISALVEAYRFERGEAGRLKSLPQFVPVGETMISGGDVLLSRCDVCRLECSFGAVLATLERGVGLSDIPRHRTAVIRYLGENGDLLVEEVSELSAAILGVFSTATVVEDGLADLVAGCADLLPPDIPARQAFAFSIGHLVERGYLGIA